MPTPRSGSQSLVRFHRTTLKVTHEPKQICKEDKTKWNQQPKQTSPAAPLKCSNPCSHAKTIARSRASLHSSWRLRQSRVQLPEVCQFPRPPLTFMRSAGSSRAFPARRWKRNSRRPPHEERQKERQTVKLC